MFLLLICFYHIVRLQMRQRCCHADSEGADGSGDLAKCFVTIAPRLVCVVVYLIIYLLPLVFGLVAGRAVNSSRSLLIRNLSVIHLGGQLGYALLLLRDEVHPVAELLAAQVAGGVVENHRV